MASIGKGGRRTEPYGGTVGEEVSLDDCSVVAHINSRGMFALNRLRIGNGYVLISSVVQFVEG